MLHLGTSVHQENHRGQEVFVIHKTREKWAEDLTTLTDPNFIRKDAQMANKRLKNRWESKFETHWNTAGSLKTK